MKKRLLLSILLKLEEIIINIKDLSKQMSSAETAIIASFDAATTAVGNRIAALIAGQAPGTLDPDFVTALNGEVTKLTSLGADGSTPPPVPAS